MAGYTLIELMFALGLAATFSVAAGASALTAVDEYRAAGAVRSLSSRLQQARMDAISKGVHVGVRFAHAGTEVTFTVYADGNRNGVRAADIQRGLDLQLRPAARLSDDFPGIAFAVLPGLPSIDNPAQPAGVDPIRTGQADMVVFTPLGTATAGTLYILGGTRRQYALRIFAETGRSRLLRFDARSGTWAPLRWI